MRASLVAALFGIAVAAVPAAARAQAWKTAWAASVQGPYPVGNATAQPELKFAFPTPEQGAHDQSFRLIVRPDVWGARTRLRFSNALGTKPLTIDGAMVGLQMSGAALVKGTNSPVTFAGKPSVTIAPGQMVWSDAARLPFAGTGTMAGRKLAVSFHVAGDSGPMTWHAKGLTTSYLSAPGAGAVTKTEDEAPYPFSTTSWYFLDAVDMDAPAVKQVIVAFGDSITDGTASTLNGDDRWPDVFSRRLHAAMGNTVSVVNEGIGGNEVVGPASYTPQTPTPGGPAATQRLERDVLSLSGVTGIVMLEGINDFQTFHAKPDAVEQGTRDIVTRTRAALPHVRFIGATLTSSLNSTNGNAGKPEVNEMRQTFNTFIRTSGIFDGIADFDAAVLDPATGAMKAEYQPNSTTGGPGDLLHPNRAGYAAMGRSVDLSLFKAGK